MLVYRTGDIFKTTADAYVNAVNTVGVMGKGLAYQFKSKYPKNFADYKAACTSGALQPGHLHVSKLDGPAYIIDFATKQDWRNPSKIEYVETGLADLQAWLVEHKNEIHSIAIPALGCGNGGLAWADVKMLIEKYLGTYAPIPKDIEIIVFPPSDAAGKSNTPEPQVGLRELVAMELAQQLDPFTMKTLTAAILYMNEAAGETLIEEGKIRDICKNISAYKKFHNFDNAQAIDAVYKRISSRFVDDKLEKYRPLMEEAAGFVSA